MTTSINYVCFDIHLNKIKVIVQIYMAIQNK